MENKYVLEIKTVQIAPFRTLMTALKDILLETNITFQPDGIKIINMDKSHTILAHLHLDASKFEYFFCKYPKIIIGVKSIAQLNNFLKKTKATQKNIINVSLYKKFFFSQNIFKERGF